MGRGERGERKRGGNRNSKMYIETEKLHLSEQEQKLIEENLGFMYYWFNLYKVYDEDRQQDMLYNLCKRIHLFNPDKGKITTFISTVNLSRLKQQSNESKSNREQFRKNIASLNNTLFAGYNEDVDLTLEDVVGSYCMDFDYIDNSDLISTIVEKLSHHNKYTQRDIEIFRECLLTGNQAEVAKMYGISRERVRQIFDRVVKTIKLKKWVEF